MMAEIHMDNRELTGFLRLTHETCKKHNDIATAGLIENWVDQAGATFLVPVGDNQRPSIYIRCEKESSCQRLQRKTE
jgi:hypothetical protein